VLIGRTQVCATGDGGQRCAEPGDVRWCQAVLALYVVKQSLNVTR